MENVPAPPRPRLGIASRLLLAAASGLLVYPLFWHGFGLESDSEIVSFIVGWGGTGLLFAGGVLLPWVNNDKWSVLRAIILVLLSALSYWCALSVSGTGGTWEDLGPDTVGYVRASIVGAAIVLVGAKLIIPLRFPIKLLAIGLPAAVLGGLVFALADNISSIDGTGGYVAHAFWHALMAATLIISQAGEWRRRTRPA